MKNKKLIPFLFLLVFATQFGAISFVSATPSQAEINYWDKYTILANQIDINLATELPDGITYQMSDPRIEAGGFTVLNSNKLNDTHIMYRSQLKAKFDFTLATTYNTADLQVTDDPISVTWARIFACEQFNIANEWALVGSSYTKVGGEYKIGRAPGPSYDVQYDPGNYYLPTSVRYLIGAKDVRMYEPTVTLSNKVMGRDVSTLGWEGNIDFDVNFEFDDSPLDFGDVVVNMERKAFVSKLTAMSVAESTQLRIDSPTPVYNDAIPEIALTENFGEVSGSTAKLKADELGLGVKLVSQNDVTVIEGEQLSVPGGATLVNNNTRLQGIKLYPNVMKRVQNYDTKYNILDIDTKTVKILGISSDLAGICREYGFSETKSNQRTTGYRIDNMHQRYTIEVTFELNALNEILAPPTEDPPILDNINHTRDVNYWDNYVTGVTNLEATYTEKDYTPGVTAFLDFLENYWWALALGVVIIAVIALVIYVKASNPRTYMQAPPREDYYPPPPPPRGRYPPPPPRGYRDPYYQGY